MRDFPEDLVAVSLDDGRIFCPRCAEKKYPEGDFPDDVTPVYESDEWKSEVVAVCSGGCGVLVDPGGAA